MQVVDTYCLTSKKRIWSISDTPESIQAARVHNRTVDMLELAEEIGAKGAGMKSLAETWADTTSAAGVMILTVMAGVATFERARLKERQREGIEAAKKAGKFKGGTKKFDDDQIRKLAADGMGPTEIMRAIGAKSTMTVYRACKAS